MAIKAKFRCNEIGKSVGWGGAEFVYKAKLSVVYGTSEENKEFFASTPSGDITIGTIRDDMFEAGEEYYVYFEKAPKPE